jgi:hypothetical protein
VSCWIKPTEHLREHSEFKDNSTYAIIGLYKIKNTPISSHEFFEKGFGAFNAQLRAKYFDVSFIITGKEGESGRLINCISIGVLEK